MILSIGNQQYEYTNMPLQKLSLQITIFLSDHKNFSPETFAVYDIKNQALQKCYTIRRDLILSMQNTPIHIMVFVSLFVHAIQNLQILLKSL